MILNKKQKINKEALLEELAKEDLQVLSLAYVYATNLHMYGEDVTKAICTATENAAMMEKAYRKGYHDAMSRMSRMKKFDVEGEMTEFLEKVRIMNDLDRDCVRWMQ